MFYQEQSFADVLQDGVVKNFANFTGKRMCWSFYLIKFHVSRPATLSNRDYNIGFFSVKFEKFLRKSFLTEHRRWLLLVSYPFLHS